MKYLKSIYLNIEMLPTSDIKEIILKNNILFK